MQTIDWTPERLKLFEIDYKKALDKGQNVFTFKGMEFDCGYAKYLIEYLTETFDSMKRKGLH